MISGKIILLARNEACKESHFVMRFWRRKNYKNDGLGAALSVDQNIPNWIGHCADVLLHFGTNFVRVRRFWRSSRPSQSVRLPPTGAAASGRERRILAAVDCCGYVSNGPLIPSFIFGVDDRDFSSFPLPCFFRDVLRIVAFLSPLTFFQLMP